MRHSFRPYIQRSGLLCLVLMLCVGCGVKRNGLPAEYQERAILSGFDAVRSFGDETPQNLSKQVKEWAQQIEGSEFAQGTLATLSLSGGGADGAFGAGVLVGWTAKGDRPKFITVTGISTGALIAPFAFLGEKYDPLITTLYTTFATKDLVKLRPIGSALAGDSFYNTEPLRLTLVKYITPELVAEIAKEHLKGRRLFIGTTNLDAMRPVYWNIGAIALKGTPEAVRLIREVILASASIPAVFPPVYFTVQVDGKPYDEMHVDGGVTNQLFAYPVSVNIMKELREIGDPRMISLYIIRNGALKAVGSAVKPTLGNIVSRSMETLIRNQGLGDIFRIYYTAKRDGMDFNLAYIPPTFHEESDEFFSPVYMSKLFNLGFGLAEDGNFWHKFPPNTLPEQ